MEEFAYVIDYVPYSAKYDRPVLYLLGEKNFTLLEATAKDNAQVSLLQRVFVGKGERDVVEKIKRKIRYEDLTPAAKENLRDALKKIILSREKFFVDFINKAPAISRRVHSLSLLPGVGKKTLDNILREREKKPFESFEEIKERVGNWADPVLSIAMKIEEEIKGESKYRFFVILPPKGGRP